MSKALEKDSSKRNLVCRILQTEKLCVKCYKHGEKVHSFHQILTTFFLKAVNNKHSGDIFQILYSFMTQWKRKIVVMSPDGCYKSAYFGRKTQKDSSSDPAVPGLQEAPPIGPQGTAKHPAPGGAAGFLEPSSSCVNSHCSVEQGSGFLFWEPWIISTGIISALLNNFSDLELFPFSLSALCHFLFPCSLILIILECFFSFISFLLNSST